MDFDYDDRLVQAIYYMGHKRVYEAACNDKLLEVCNDKEYFDMSCLIKFMMVLSCKPNLTDEDKLIMQKYNDMINSLNLKCKEKTLTDDESKFLLSMLSTQLIDYNECSKETMNIYLNNYFFKGKRFFNSDELIVLNSYFLDFLNQMFNSNVKLHYSTSYFTSASFSISRNDNDVELSIVKDPYLELQRNDSISQSDYYYVFVYQVWAMLHEFCHNLQYEAMIKGKSHDDIERIKKEYVININNRDFYNKFHNSFKIEHEADEFALKYLQVLLKTVIPPNVLEDSIKKLLLDYKKSNEKNISEVKFEQLLDKEYEKLDADERDISNYIK